jgi:hypothetical protein
VKYLERSFSVPIQVDIPQEEWDRIFRRDTVAAELINDLQRQVYELKAELAKLGKLYDDLFVKVVALDDSEEEV